MFLREQEVVLDGDGLFNILQLEVISFNGSIYSLVQTFLKDLLVDIREDECNLEEEGQKSSYLTQTGTYTFWVEFVLQVDILYIKRDCGFRFKATLAACKFCNCSQSISIWHRKNIYPDAFKLR